jgi:hypothetical protein
MTVPRKKIKAGDMKEMINPSSREGEIRIVTNSGEGLGDHVIDGYNDVWEVIEVFPSEKATVNNQKVDLVKMRIKCVGHKQETEETDET